MIGKLRGYVDTVRDDHLLLEVNGVGYGVFASTATLARLRQESGLVSLFIETHVREDHIHLYGFMFETEQEMFTLLTTVQGVGNKMALSILGVFSEEEIAAIILVQDTASLTRVSGIGKRIAERIVVELKNKLPSLSGLSGSVKETTKIQVPGGTDLPLASIMHDAISALEHLGYSRVDAHRACQSSMQQGAATLDDIIPFALNLLSKR